MAERILCVDDEPHVLEACRRALRKRFQIETALGAAEGLNAIARGEPFAVIISDMRMPGMDGVQFLARVREIAPNTVRMMLTGNADQQTAVNAVNEGQIFRFLNKPCPPETLAQAIESGIAQYRLITAERELLEKTLKGSVKVLTDILSLVNPTAFGRASRVTRLVRQFTAKLELEPAWPIEIAAMLSQIGLVTVPEATLAKVYRGGLLSKEESQTFAGHPKVGRDLLANIPRLESVAEIIAYQEKHFDGTGPPAEARRGETIPAGARILKIVLDYDTLTFSVGATADAVTQMRSREGWYDPTLVEVLERVVAAEARHDVRFITISELMSEMILAQDVMAASGMLLIAKGQEVTPSMCVRLKNFAMMGGGVSEPLKVFVPSKSEPANGGSHSGASPIMKGEKNHAG